MTRLRVLPSLLLAGLFAAATSGQEGPRPLMRFPDVHGDTVVFSHAEDLWLASTAGGAAVRLTIHDGSERFPRFSPDGQHIAFTGQYDGNSDVYLMNRNGGELRRLTFHPGADVVVGWHPVKGKVLFRSARRAWSRFERLYLIGIDGSGLEEMILHEAAAGSISADGGRIVYNRIAREQRTWKRYRGGLAQDLWLFDFNSQEDRRLTKYDGTDRLPMWIGEQIFFSSDRDRTLNLYSIDPQSQEVVQVTHHSDYDARWPSSGDGRQIVYEHGGELWILDTASRESRKLAIEVRVDAAEARPRFNDVSEEVRHLAVSPNGKRVLLEARGEIFSVPAENGPTRNLTQSSGVREKDPAWSPDGKFVAYLSDHGGEWSIHVASTSNPANVRVLAGSKQGYRHTLRWSPDSSKIAFADHSLRFFYLDLESGNVTEVDRSATEPVDVGIDHKPIHDYSWSPDSRFLAYSKMDADLVSRLYIYSLESARSHCVSGEIFNDFNPVFSADGQHLLFISNRRFDPTFCDFEWEMVYKKVAGVYSLTLRKAGPALLPFRNDEEQVADTKVDEEAASEVLQIDFDGLAERIEALPLPRGNYRRLAVTEDAVFFLNAENGDFNRFEYRALGARDLKAFSFSSRKVQSVLSGVHDYAVAASGSHLAYRRGTKVGILPASARDSSGEDLSLSGLRMWWEPRQEWHQLFTEAWRMERDFYYEPNMHGVDWAAMKEKYGGLLPFASCRQDVGYLIGEMIGELNTSHTYVFGGDQERSSESVRVGLLGADWELDPESNRYRLQKILRVPDWTLSVTPPLMRPGVQAEVGDYLLKVDDREVRGPGSIYAFFQGLAGKQVKITLNDQPTLDGARESVVRPVGSERTLRYRAWLEHNRNVVSVASDGRLGYLHLPDTYTGSAREFPKYFYSQTQKQGLIIDGRFNGGGLDPDIFLQRLDKQVMAWWTRRYSATQTTPAVVTQAHLVCLTNRQAGSGGDMLPMEFQMKGMGPVIGTRTWGGLVGVSMFLQLIDGGGLTAPDYRIYSGDGRWLVENEGVEPDIVVDLSPAEMARGYDAQLMRAVEYLLRKIEEEPRPVPKAPSFPVDREGG
jgi:tricorn protease